jgi:pimeloyl-ACP methyl ester carboxylesterase
VRPVAARSRPENDSGVDPPETRYAKTVDGLSIAYQVLGRGPVDLVLTPGWISNVDAAWDVPPLRSFFRQLASISRLILFDRRGSGLSDRPTQVESLALEHGVDDLRAVMDAAGSDRAVLFGFEDGGMLAGMFAATHPDRTVALVLFAPWVKVLKTPDYPFGWSEAEQEEWERHIAAEWGTTAFTRWQFTLIAPGLEAKPSSKRSPATGARARAQRPPRRLMPCISRSMLARSFGPSTCRRSS